MPNYIALAIPFFLVLIAVELFAARVRGLDVYRLQDALSDLGCGIGQQVVLVFAGAALLEAYAALYRHGHLFAFKPGSALPWIVAFLAVDFVYYVWHRLSHQVNFLWAAHVVHHQSEDYNLAVALRQSILTSFTTLPFNLPLAILGIPPVVYAAMQALSTLYQFWIHTQLIGKLGFLEAFLNTPSHHRVHHAVNTRYLDRNYGAVLIVWDRLFGTFAEEVEPAIYGTVKPLRTFNPALAQVAGWVEMGARARQLRRWRERVRIPWASPGAGSSAASDRELERRVKWASAISPSLKAYALLQFATLVAATFVLLLSQDKAPWSNLAIGALLVLWALASVGGLLDGRRWAVPLELARLGGVVVAVGWGTRELKVFAMAAAMGACVGAAVWLLAASSRLPFERDEMRAQPEART